MYSLGRYFSAIFSIFFRWWWAAITGTFTIIGFILTANEGITLTRYAFSIMVFVGFCLLFLVISITIVSWRWFRIGGVFPRVVSIIPEKPGNNALTLIVQSDQARLSEGSFWALYLINKYNIEISAAVFEITTQRTDGNGFQAEPRWISPVHKTSFQKGEIKLEDIKLRFVSKEALQLVEKCIREDS